MTRPINLTDAELDELGQFLFWVEDRYLEGGPWWPGEDERINFQQGDVLSAAVQKVQRSWNRMKGLYVG